MEKLLADNKELSSRIRELKEKLLELNSLNFNTGNHGVMEQIIGMKEVSDELKSLLVLLHTNSTTSDIERSNHNIMVQIKANDIIHDLIETHNALLAHLQNANKPKKSKIDMKWLIGSKLGLMSMAITTFFLLWVMNSLDPDAFSGIIEVIQSLFKLK